MSFIRSRLHFLMDFDCKIWCKYCSTTNKFMKHNNYKNLVKILSCFAFHYIIFPRILRKLRPISILCFANFFKFQENFAKHEISNFVKILRKYKNENFCIHPFCNRGSQFIYWRNTRENCCGAETTRSCT